MLGVCMLGGWGGCWELVGDGGFGGVGGVGGEAPPIPRITQIGGWGRFRVLGF